MKEGKQMTIKYTTFKNEPKEFSGWVKTFLNGTHEVTEIPSKTFYQQAEELVKTGIDCVAVSGTYAYYETVYDALDYLILTFIEEHKLDEEETLANIHHTLVAKNIDYGNSFDNVVDLMGLPGAVIRILDKFNRLKTLQGAAGEVGDESTVDTELDFIGYLMLTLHYYQDKKEG